MVRWLALVVVVVGMAAGSVAVADPVEPAGSVDPVDPVAVASPAGPADPADTRWSAELSVRELTAPSGFRLRVTYAPEVAPGFQDHLFLVQADSAFGESAYLIPTDIALEYGDAVYAVHTGQVSDVFGSILGGRLGEGESQVGFFFVPAAIDVPGLLQELQVRYANRRAGFTPSGLEEDWDSELPPGTLMASINAWWAAAQSMAQLDSVSETDAWIMADRIMPGQAELVLASEISPVELRNTILRVGDRHLVRTPITQRVVPRYPTAARQAGVGGLVIVLAYTSERGAVEDVTLLASDTAHLLNFSAVEAVGQWRFVPAKNKKKVPIDGWRVVPIQFQVGNQRPEPAPLPSALRSDPVLLRKASAEYPEKAFHKRIEGTVIYEVTVGKGGRLLQAVLVQSVHPLVDRTALVAVEKCLFDPARKRGVPVEGTLRISYVFPPP